MEGWLVGWLVGWVNGWVGGVGGWEEWQQEQGAWRVGGPVLEVSAPAPRQRPRACMTVMSAASRSSVSGAFVYMISTG